MQKQICWLTWPAFACRWNQWIWFNQYLILSCLVPHTWLALVTLLFCYLISNWLLQEMEDEYRDLYKRLVVHEIGGQNTSTTYRSISGNTTRFWPIRAWLRGLFLPLLRKMSNHWFRKVNKSLIHFRDAICKYVDGEDFEIVYEHPALQDEEWWCLHEDKLDSYSTNISPSNTIKIWNTSWIYHLPYLLSAPFLYTFFVIFFYLLSTPAGLRTNRMQKSFS